MSETCPRVYVTLCVMAGFVIATGREYCLLTTALTATLRTDCSGVVLPLHVLTDESELITNEALLLPF